MADFSEITENIFIGNVFSVAGNRFTGQNHILDILNIEVVISALTLPEYSNYFSQSYTPSKDRIWHKLIIEDDETEHISEHFTQVYSIISKALKENKKVIVHCAAGISRSPSLVIAYFMLENKWNYEHARNFVQSKRYCIRPNNSFIQQLKNLEDLLRLEPESKTEIPHF